MYPNLLENFPFANPKLYVRHVTAIAIACASWILVFAISPAIATVILLIFLIVCSAFYLELGIYVIAGTAFFNGLEISLGRMSWVREIPYLAEINGPLIDFVVLGFCVSAIIALVFRVYPIKEGGLKKLFPHARWYLGFLVVGALSAYTAYEHNMMVSLKYFARPMVFVYIMFVSLPILLVKTRDILDRVLYFLYVIGGAVAVFGFVGLIRSIWTYSWVRVEPFPFFGIAPLGYNHNMIAQVLIALIPIVAYIAFFRSSKENVKWRLGVLGSMIAVCLLTLSRAAWIMLFVEGAVAAILFRDHVKKMMKKYEAFLFPIGLVLVAIVGYMVIFLGTSIVTSSNVARLGTTEITFFYVAREPFIGYGPGMFTYLMNDTYAHLLNFGEALDAHGLIQKISLEDGLIGLFFFLMFLYMILKTTKKGAWESGDPLLMFLWCMVIGAIGYEFFDTSYFNSNMWFPIGLALAAYQLYLYGDNYLTEKK